MHNNQVQLLRIFIGENDKIHGKPLYEQIIQQARSEKLAGATVLRGFEGFGRHSHMHTAKVLRLSSNLPIVIEIVDTEDKINAFLPILEEHIEDGLVTVQNVNAVFYRKNE